MKREKIVIYGTGGTAKFYVDNDMDRNKFELVAFSDSNEEKWNTVFLGYPVLEPAALRNIEFDIIMIASVFYDSIKERLIREIAVNPEKIRNIYYRQTEDLKDRYARFYNRKNLILWNDENGKTVQKNDRIAIYTAIAGDYDKLRDPAYYDENCSYICYTDNPAIQSDIWEIRKLPDWENDFNRSAKQIKVLPHLFLPEYEWSIWIDGSFEITGNVRELMHTYMRNGSILCFMHYRRSSVYEEAKVVGAAGFDDAETIRNQITRYREEGFTDDNELIAGGVLFRRHHQPDVIRLMEAWWKEIIDNSRRDQLSFNYCAWKEKVVFDMIDMNIYDNSYFKVYPHNKKKTEGK